MTPAFCRQLARARRDKGMTQSAVAEAVGCKQSAISMLESGQPEKLSKESVEKIAKLLGVPFETAAHPPSALSLQPSPAAPHGFCPRAACVSSVPYVVQGELLFWPRLQPLAAGGRCAFCGELLESRCPHCGAALATEGGCCPACGGARVTNTLPAEPDVEGWAARRRREIAEWRALLTP